MENIPSWLNYGALGLLALVLVGVYFLFQSIVKRMNEAQKFTEQLAVNSIDSIRQLTAESLQVARDSQRVAKESVEMQGKISHVLDNLCQQVEAMNGKTDKDLSQLREEHRAIISRIDRGFADARIGRGHGE